MKCKDCINYDVCSTQSVNCDRADNCSMFKNESQYIKLPCKVGDTVYILAGPFGNEYEQDVCVWVFIVITEFRM